MYKILAREEMDGTLRNLDKWERDWKTTWNDEVKRTILSLTHKASICTTIQESGYKILSRWYRTLQVLLVLRGTGRVSGTHLLELPQDPDFLHRVTMAYQMVTQDIIKLDPALFLFHVTGTPTKQYRKWLLRHLINSAQACIPCLWKSKEVPTIRMWISKVNEIKRIEDILASMEGTIQQHYATWVRWESLTGSVKCYTLIRTDSRTRGGREGEGWREEERWEKQGETESISVSKIKRIISKSI